MSNLTLTKEDILDVMGDEAEGFLKVMAIMEDIIENTDKYSGVKALVTASKLAAYRTKIGAQANWLKSQEKSILGRRKKDLLISLENNLLENINVMKMAARLDAKAAGIM